MRGYRVGEISARFQPARPPVAEAWPHPGDFWRCGGSGGGIGRPASKSCGSTRKQLDAIPAGPGLRIDAVQSPTRHDAEARKRDSA